MGLFGAIKGGIKKVGGLAKKAAPFLPLIPGVGTLAAAGIGLGGGLLSGGGLKGAAEGALGGAAGGLAKAGLSRIPGVGKFAQGAGQQLLGLGQPGGGFLGKVGQFAMDRPELALGAVGAIQNAHAGNRFEGQQQQVRDFAQQQMAQQQAIQKMILDRLANRQPQDFGVDLSDPGNPFTRGA